MGPRGIRSRRDVVTAMDMRFARRAATLGIVFLAVAAMQAAPPSLPLLGTLEPGRWELRDDDNRLISSICLGDPGQLVQLQHAGQNCARSLLSADSRNVTVRYACPRTGFGRTTILVETPRLVQVESQGLANGTPFALHVEARKAGPCR